MVAIKGKGWELVPCLVALVNEVDRAYPNRAKVSDGSIGDLAHASRSSQHNPDTTGDVRAVDITEDHTNGPDLRALWNHIIRRQDPRVLYLIYEGQIVKSYTDNRMRAAWVPQPYTGVNAHAHHLHVSVLDTDQKHNTGPWLPASPSHEEDDMTPEQELALARVDTHVEDLHAFMSALKDGKILDTLKTAPSSVQKLTDLHAEMSRNKGNLRALLDVGLPQTLETIKAQLVALSAPADVRIQVADLLREASDDLRSG